MSSISGFYEWWYNELESGKHFMQIKPEMDDLLEKIG